MSSTIDSTTVTTAEPSRWHRLEQALTRLVENFNPILIKETRQALKSRQFVFTFMITLLACWIATFWVVLSYGTEVYYVASGDQFLSWYCVILAFPLMIVVPYSAYRSIAAEQEDNTYDLLSITTLNARQIVTGKLGSALVQMLVYLCAVSPCIAFTFLLRGVDLLLVAILLVGFFLVSLGESMLAILIGTMAKVRYTQALTSVLVVISSFGMFWLGVAGTISFVQESDSIIRDWEFWVVTAMVLTVYVTTFLLAHAAAAAQIAFPSENRSTRLRWFMLLQFACFLGWMAVAANIDSRGNIARMIPVVTSVTTLTSAVYWYFMGMLLSSEWPHLSRRVQRSLPQSNLGQMLLTWFNPGPGTGFMFAVANLSAVVVGSLLALLMVGPQTFAGYSTQQAVYLVCLVWCYVVSFLGIGTLMVALLRRYFFISITAGFLLQVIMALCASGIPQIVTLMSNRFGSSNYYSLLHITNPFWTLIEANQSASFYTTPEGTILTYVLPATATIVLLLTLRLVAGEVRHQRRSLPARVAEEEAELQPALVMGPSSPWDMSEEENSGSAS